MDEKKQNVGCKCRNIPELKFKNATIIKIFASVKQNHFNVS